MSVKQREHTLLVEGSVFLSFFPPFFPINKWQLKNSAPENSRYRVTRQTWIKTYVTCVTVLHTGGFRWPWQKMPQIQFILISCWSFSCDFLLFLLVFIYLEKLLRCSVNLLCEPCCYSTSCILKQKWWELPVAGNVLTPQMALTSFCSVTSSKTRFSGAANVYDLSSWHMSSDPVGLADLDD